MVVPRHVVEKIHALKLKTVIVRAGRAVRKYKDVKSDRPDELIFQSVREGKPMRDNNVLSRFIKPAGHRSWLCELALLENSYGRHPGSSCGGSGTFFWWFKRSSLQKAMSSSRRASKTNLNFCIQVASDCKTFAFQ